MPLSSTLRKHRGTAVFLVLIGGFFAFQSFWPRAAVLGPPVEHDKKVVRASVDRERTLHGQVDELKTQIDGLVTNLTGVAKHLKEVQSVQADTQEARLREQKEHAREKEAAKRREEQLREQLDEERKRRERDKASQATARAVAKKEPEHVAAVPRPMAVFQLRTIGTSQGRPKHAPTPLMHHVDTAYLPAGCFAKVRLVTGVSATSQLGSSGGASWGHPMLYVIREPFECARRLDEIGMAALRARVRVPLDGGLGFATGKADLASSRVQGEATLLSFVMPDGEAYEVPIKGYLVGADGVQGIVGEIQTHESAKIGKAFIAGLLQEAAAYFSAARKGVSISVTGQTLPYGGMETTLQAIGKYWLEQARALQPTLFVPSNTEAYLVILQGVPLEGMHLVNWLKTGVM